LLHQSTRVPCYLDDRTLTAFSLEWSGISVSVWFAFLFWLRVLPEFQGFLFCFVFYKNKMLIAETLSTP
jgi:hypothetical protein